jgi:hypothetical protein
MKQVDSVPNREITFPRVKPIWSLVASSSLIPGSATSSENARSPEGCFTVPFGHSNPLSTLHSRRSTQTEQGFAFGRRLLSFPRLRENPAIEQFQEYVSLTRRR